MTDLKPCPFCGGKAWHYALGPIEHHIECTNPKCCAVTGGWMTEDEAIAAWNARAERTCEWELEHSGTLYDKWRCSECGYLFVEPRCDQGYTDMEPNYCPNCGAKVVEQ